jgi:phosphate transport system permease protein
MNNLLTAHFRHLSTSEKILRILCIASVFIIFFVICGIISSLLYYSAPALKQFGLSFLFSRSWNPGTIQFGALTSIYGTMATTLIASIIALPISIMAALYISEFSHPVISRFFGTVIEILSAIPSVIYGLWGLFVLVPVMSSLVQPLLQALCGSLPFFKGALNGLGILTAGIILAIMIIPFTINATRQILDKVPSEIKDASYSLGATQWETIHALLLRFCSPGILGTCLLGVSKALGEAVAVAFVIGNKHIISLSLFSSGNTIGSTLVNEFVEAPDKLHRSALIELGLVLFIITVGVHTIARLWLRKINVVSGVE